MRKVIVLTFLSMDGVMQGPGGPEEDTSDGFKLGGWTVPYFDEFLGEVMTEQMGKPFDLLLGRKTFEIFATYWPHQPAPNPLHEATKYVASKTMSSHDWQKSVFLKGDVAEEVKKLKMLKGPDLQVHGSGNLIQTLIKHDLVDEFWLKIFPVTVGQGKRLFGDGAIPAAFKAQNAKTSPSGVVVVNYARTGEFKTGTFE